MTDEPLESKQSDEQAKPQRRSVSRRQVIASLGAAGAAWVAGAWLQSGTLYGAEKDTVTDAVYGREKVSARDLMETDFVVALSIAELRGLQSPNPDSVYFITDTGREGHFYFDASDRITADNGGTVLVTSVGGRFKRLFGGSLNVSWFGAKGDGTTDDTMAVRSALESAKGKELIFPPGVFLLTDTISIPRNTFVKGAGCSSWFTFGQRRNDLPDSILDMENGTILLFTGNGSVRYSSNRTDFQSFTCAVKLASDGDGIQLSDLKISSYFRIRDEAGHITTPETDKHAMFDVGLWVDNADHVKLNRVSVVGYWQKAGLFVDASGRISQGGEYGAVEYVTVKDCVFQGKIGMALLGGDEGNPPDSTGFLPPENEDDLSEGRFGLSHFLVSDCFFSGTDHHSNGFVSGWQQRIAPDSTPLKIDGFIGSGVPYRINHPRFVNCSFQTRESASIILERVTRPTFVNCRAESGPVRASQYTVLPRLINCEFPYNRSNTDYQEIEHCSGAVIVPPFRRLGQLHLQDYQFQIELRNNSGVIEHRMAKAFGIQAGGKSRDVEALFRFPIMEAGWDYRAWTATPMPGSTGADDFSKGLYAGEKPFLSKYQLFTCAAVDNHPDYQEMGITIVESRAADTNLWARAAVYSMQKVPYRIANYSTALKIELRNGSGPAAGLTANLPNESNGPASLILRIRGKFYEQAYGLV